MHGTDHRQHEENKQGKKEKSVVLKEFYRVEELSNDRSPSNIVSIDELDKPSAVVNKFVNWSIPLSYYLEVLHWWLQYLIGKQFPGMSQLSSDDLFV